MTDTQARTDQVVEVTANGPYHVTGAIPIYRVRRVPAPGARGSFSEWEIYGRVDAPEEYWLCRCGHSTNKPFCTGAHETVGFDGTETAPTNTYAERASELGGTRIAVRDDRGICAHAAFCSNATTNVWKAAKLTDDDTAVGDVVLGMVRNCPSGALTVTVDGSPVEPEIDPQIWIQEDGSILLRGGITVRRADGEPIETRNRMALCRCGESKIKPLCDGSHFDAGFKDG